MARDSHSHRRVSPLTFTLMGLSVAAFAAFPLLRPWGDKAGSPEVQAAAFADSLWVFSHLSGMVGWALLATAAVVSAGLAIRTKALLVLGVAALLPYYGAETFALHVLGRAALRREDLSLMEFEAVIRAEPVAVVLFGLGLIVAAIGAILVAVDTWRAGHLRWSGIPLAVLIALYLPQFFAAGGARIVHGLLLGVACLLWAMASQRTPVEVTSAAQP